MAYTRTAPQRTGTQIGILWACFLISLISVVNNSTAEEQGSVPFKGKNTVSQIIPLTEEKLPSDGYIFKHSTQCPISAAAAQVVKAHEWDRPVYWVNVIEQRPLSNWVASTFGVQHESPQLIVIENGTVTKTLSHRAIREENL